MTKSPAAGKCDAAPLYPPIQTMAFLLSCNNLRDSRVTWQALDSLNMQYIRGAYTRLKNTSVSEIAITFFYTTKIFKYTER